MKTKQSDLYMKVVEWSEEDNCYIGTIPGLITGGIHGKDPRKVFNELCLTVKEAIGLYKADGKPLPAPTAGKNYSGKIALRISSDLHRKIAIRAGQEGESINKFIEHKLEKNI